MSEQKAISNRTILKLGSYLCVSIKNCELERSIDDALATVPDYPLTEEELDDTKDDVFREGTRVLESNAKEYETIAGGVS